MIILLSRLAVGLVVTLFAGREGNACRRRLLRGLVRPMVSYSCSCSHIHTLLVLQVVLQSVVFGDLRVTLPRELLLLLLSLRLMRYAGSPLLWLILSARLPAADTHKHLAEYLLRLLDQ